MRQPTRISFAASAQIIPREVMILKRVGRHQRQLAPEVRHLGQQLLKTKALLGETAAHLKTLMSGYSQMQAHSRETAAFCKSCSKIFDGDVPLEAMVKARDELLKRHQNMGNNSQLEAFEQFEGFQDTIK